MTHQSVDLEPADVLKVILARKRNPCLDAMGLRIDRTDLRMVGEAEIALPIGCRVARGSRHRREECEHRK
jgi:hypothetical protein